MTRTYKDITYTIARSDRKTASIYIERDGQVSLLVPSTLSEIADRVADREQAALDLQEPRRVA